MEIKRTANAGILLRLDGKRILMDGVCREVKSYLATPSHVREALLKELPDALLITHCHADHYDAAFVSEYLQKTAGPVLGPADIPFCSTEVYGVGEVRITTVPSRHIGKKEPMGHMSFIVEGSRCVWFLGDASPLQWQGREDLPRPEVLVAPYAYAIGTGWQVTKKLAPRLLVLLHLPPREDDPCGLWDAVEQTLQNRDGPQVYIPAMGQTITV